MYEKEKIVKEQRLNLAMDNKFVGLEGKFGRILLTLGTKIYSQNSIGDMYETNIAVDVWELQNDSLPVLEQGGSQIGLYFDGLRRGMHLEIKYIEDENSITVRYKGRIVYLEVNNDLQCYVPAPEWEKIIVRLMPQVEKKEYEMLEEVDNQRKTIAEKRKKDFLQYLNKKWGF